MDFIFIIVAIVWLILKLPGGATSKSGGLNDIEKYETFEKVRKK